MPLNNSQINALLTWTLYRANFIYIKYGSDELHLAIYELLVRLWETERLLLDFKTSRICALYCTLTAAFHFY